MSQVFEEFRGRWFEIMEEPADQRTPAIEQLVLDRGKAVEALSEEELVEALKAIDEQESSLFIHPGDGLIEPEGWPLLESLRQDRLFIHLEQMRRGITPEVQVESVEQNT